MGPSVSMAGCGKSHPTEIRPPGRPPHNESYLLSYSGPLTDDKVVMNLKASRGWECQIQTVVTQSVVRKDSGMTSIIGRI